ncbi:MAG: plasmid mobilization relaxosome protein MobC [Rikenellaceae bacterium]
MKSKNRGGRPTVEEAKRRSYSVNIRVNSQELAMLRLSAKEAGVSDSEYARQAIVKGKVEPRISPETMGLIRRLCGMDNNLNQIARQANAAGYTPVHRECLRLTDQIGSVIKDLRR